MITHPLPPDDLEHVLAHTREDWEEIRGKKIFITGGTGFFGIWLLESFAHANQRLSLRAKVTVLTRDPERIAARFPNLWNDPSITFLKGDVRSFGFPEDDFQFIIHAATDPISRTCKNSALQSYLDIVTGTERVLYFNQQCKADKLLYISSGAVYGIQPNSLTHIPETYAGAPDTMRPFSYYGEAKRVSEFLCATHGKENNYQTKIARCFSFIGPHLPLDGPYAIGNFLRDAMANRPIAVKGDGLSYRSYLYAADLAIWLWRILFSGTPFQPYNVGSNKALSISELASLVANKLNSNHPPHIGLAPEKDTLFSRYVPDTGLAEKELDLHSLIPLEDAICKTAAWHGM